MLGVHISLTDETLTHSNVSTVLNTVKVDRLQDCLNIPTSEWDKISGDEQQRHDECIHYWIHVSPYTSWTYLAGELHYKGETAAVEAAKRYFQRAPGVCGCGMCMYWNVEDAYDHVYMTRQLIHACSDVHCVCSSAFVDYTDAHTDHICAHVHHPTQSQHSLITH